MSLRSVNLNLVPILRELLRTRSVTKAADLLGLSQGAASNALSRLRATFDDPLLVRVGAHMELTPRAVDLLPSTEALCVELEGYFSSPRFDPTTMDRTFTVASSDYATFLMAGSLLTAIDKVAPLVSLRFVDVIDRLNERMAEREVDIAIVPESFLTLMAPARFNAVRLLSEQSVAVFWREHPLAARATVNIEDLAQYRSITFHPSSKQLERRDPTVFMGGHDFDVAVYVPQVTSPCYLLPGTAYFSIEPSRVAKRMAEFLPLEIRPLGFPTPPMYITLAWSAVHDRDPAHRWFRNITRETVAEPMPE